MLRLRFDSIDRLNRLWRLLPRQGGCKEGRVKDKVAFRYTRARVKAIGNIVGT